MNFYKLTLSYQGSAYKGWQIQPDARTVQGELNKSLKKMLKSQLRTIGSGRTDAGVHALAQVVRLESEQSISIQALFKGLNSLLPNDIKVLDVTESSESFHPILSAQAKEYWYLMSFKSNLSPFESSLITKFHGQIELDKLHEACRLFIGRHDFSHYFCVGTDIQSSVREIYECELIFVDQVGHWSELSLSGPYYYLRIRGNGFLKQMVRLIVGTMIKYAKGQLNLEDIRVSLKDGKRPHLAPVAPPQGLYLAEVFY